MDHQWNYGTSYHHDPSKDFYFKVRCDRCKQEAVKQTIRASDGSSSVTYVGSYNWKTEERF